MDDQDFYNKFNVIVTKILSDLELYGYVVHHDHHQYIMDAVDEQDCEISGMLLTLKYQLHISFPAILRENDVDKASKQDFFHELRYMVTMVDMYSQMIEKSSPVLDSCAFIIVILHFIEETRVVTYDILLKFFMKCQCQRYTVLNYVFEILKVSHEQNFIKKHVQITELVLSLIQTVPAANLPAGNIISNIQNEHILSTYREAFEGSLKEVHRLVCRWVYLLLFADAEPCKGQKADVRYFAVLKQFTAHLLVLVESPRYLSSFFVILIVLKVLVEIMRNKKNSSLLRKWVLEQINVLAIKLREWKIRTEQNREEIRRILRENYPQHAGPLMQIETNDEFLSDVDMCLNSCLIRFLNNCFLGTDKSSVSSVYFYIMNFCCTTSSSEQQLNNGRKRKLSDTEEKNMIDEIYLSRMLQSLQTGYESYEVNKKEAFVVYQHLLMSRFKVESLSRRYFLQVILMASDDITIIRLSAIKSMMSILKTDRALMFDPTLKIVIQSSILDNSPVIRENTLQLLTKIIKTFSPEAYIQIFENFDQLLKRLLDVNASVRKVAVIMLAEFCLENRENKVVMEIISKILSRVSDKDEVVAGRVIEAFHHLWFEYPNPGVEEEILELCNRNPSHFEVLINNITTPQPLASIKGKLISFSYQTRLNLVMECFRQVMSHIEQLGLVCYNVGVVNFYYTLAKIVPGLLPDYLDNVFSYLMKCIQNLNRYENDVNPLRRILKIMQIVISVMDAELKLQYAGNIRQFVGGQLPHLNMNLFVDMLSFYIYCLKNIPNSRDEINRLHTDSLNSLTAYYLQDSKQITMNTVDKNIITLGSFVAIFDSSEAPLESTRELICYVICSLKPAEVTSMMVKTLGLISTRYPEVWNEEKVQQLYLSILNSRHTDVQCKIEVLENVFRVLKKEETAPIENSAATHVALITKYLGPALKLYHNPHLKLRLIIAKLTMFCCQRLLLNPFSVVAHLICMLTDGPNIRLEAEKTLEFVARRYPIFIHSSLSMGIKLACRLQIVLKNNKCSDYVASDSSVAVLSVLYVNLQPSMRQIFIRNLLHEFENKDLALTLIEFVATNLAFIPYKDCKEIQFVVDNMNAFNRAVSAVSAIATQCNFPEHDGLQLKNNLEEYLIHHADRVIGKWSDEWLVAANICILLLYLRKYLQRLIADFKKKTKFTVPFRIPDSFEVLKQCQQNRTSEACCIPVLVQTYLQLQNIFEELSH